MSNSWTKFAWVEKGKVQQVRRCPTAQLVVEDFVRMRELMPQSSLILASVVPSKALLAEKVFQEACFSIHGQADLGLEIDYPQPEQIGADRLANAVAANHLYQAPLVVVDFGTAVTFDVLNAQGAYCGGVIVPGLYAMTDYLHERTALLPKIELDQPHQVIGQSTTEAMMSGAYYGYRGMIRTILAHIQEELACEQLPVIVTGGQGEVVAKEMSEVHEVNPLLTLEGLRIIGTRYDQKSH